MSNEFNRRHFLTGALAGSAVLTAGLPTIVRADDSVETVTIGVVGMSRGKALALDFVKAPGCHIKYVCDVDRNRLAEGQADIGKASGRIPEAVGDFRRILDDPEVDAVAFALPVHWHAPAAILACKAGKHVYVEKPCCHNPREGELLVEAARKYNRVVQMGAQRRSSKVIIEGMTKMLEGAIGRPYYARAWYAALRGSMGRGENGTPPEYLDYDLWQGPAPRRPYRGNVIHYNWHWLWHYGAGEAGNNGPHMLDIARWGLGVEYPARVSAAGGRYRFNDDQETPDTQMLTYDFEGGKTVTWEGLSCNQPGPEGMFVGITFYGENGSLIIGHVNYILRDANGKVIEEKTGDVGGVDHAVNFLNAIRTNAPNSLNCEIECGYRSTLLAHLGNIAYRTGHVLHCDEKGHIIDDAEAQALWQRVYEPGWEPTV